MRSLRSSAAYRIAFSYAAGFALAILLLGTAVYFAADAEFRSQRDDAIGEEAVALARSEPASLRREIAQREEARGSDRFGYALFDTAGRRVAGKLRTRMPQIGLGTIVFDDPREGPDVARASTIALGDGRRLVVAADAEAIERIDATILALFGAAFVVILLVGAAGALVLGRYLQRRLAIISDTARSIVAGDLARRVPIGAAGDEFDRVGDGLNAMLDRIALLMENLRQVSSDVAHDLRTPLLRLRAQLETLGDDARATKAIERGDELLRLFDAILRIAELERGGLASSFVTVDASALAEDVGDSFLPAMIDSGRTLRWTVEPGVRVAGNRDLLAQALANLIDNARVHTLAGNDVALTLDIDDASARLTVADNGPGVPEADRERIVQRFYRGEASRTTPGNGLGLSLVAAVAAAHGGSLVIGNADPGLRATIVLPRCRS